MPSRGTGVQKSRHGAPNPFAARPDEGTGSRRGGMPISRHGAPSMFPEVRARESAPDAPKNYLTDDPVPGLGRFGYDADPVMDEMKFVAVSARAWRSYSADMKGRKVSEIRKPRTGDEAIAFWRTAAASEEVRDNLYKRVKGAASFYAIVDKAKGGYRGTVDLLSNAMMGVIGRERLTPEQQRAFWGSGEMDWEDAKNRAMSESVLLRMAGGGAHLIGTLPFMGPAIKAGGIVKGLAATGLVTTQGDWKERTTSGASNAVFGTFAKGLGPFARLALGKSPRAWRSVVTEMGKITIAGGGTRFVMGDEVLDAESIGSDLMLAVAFKSSEIRKGIVGTARGQIRKARLAKAKIDRVERFAARESMAKRGSAKIVSEEAAAMEGVGESGPAGVELREPARDASSLSGDKLAEEYTYQTGKSVTIPERPLTENQKRRRVAGKAKSQKKRAAAMKLEGEKLDAAYEKAMGEKPILPERRRSDSDMRSELQQRADRKTPKRKPEAKTESELEAVTKVLEKLSEGEVREIWEDEVLAPRVEAERARMSAEEQAQYEAAVQKAAELHTQSMWEDAIRSGRPVMSPGELFRANVRAIHLGLPMPDPVIKTDAPKPRRAKGGDAPFGRDGLPDVERLTKNEMVADIVRESFGESGMPEGKTLPEGGTPEGGGGVYVEAGGGKAETVGAARKRAASVSRPETRPEAEASVEPPAGEDARISEYITGLPSATLRKKYRDIRGGGTASVGRKAYEMVVGEAMRRDARKPGYKSPFGYHEGGIRLKSEAPPASTADIAKSKLMSDLMSMDIVKLRNAFVRAGGTPGRDEGSERYRKRWANFVFAAEAKNRGLNELPAWKKERIEAARKRDNPAESVVVEEEAKTDLGVKSEVSNEIDTALDSVPGPTSRSGLYAAQRGMVNVQTIEEFASEMSKGKDIARGAIIEGFRELRHFGGMIYRIGKIAEKFPEPMREKAMEFVRVAFNANADASPIAGKMSQELADVKRLTGKIAGEYSRATRAVQTPIFVRGAKWYKVPWVEMVEGRMKPRSKAEAEIIESVRKLIAKRGAIVKAMGVEGFDMPKGKEGWVVPREFPAEFMEVLREGPGAFRDGGRTWNRSVEAWSESTGQSAEYIEGRFMAMHKALRMGSHSNVVKAQFEFSRDPLLRQIPHGIKDNTTNIRFIDNSIFGYADSFVRRGSARLSVLKNLPDDVVADYRKAFQGEANEGAFNDTVRALSGMAMHRRIVDPHGNLGSVLRGINQAWRPMQSLITSARAFVNSVEMAGTPLDAAGYKVWLNTVLDTMPVIRGVRGKGKTFADEQLGMNMEFKSLNEMLEALGASTLDIRNWGFNPLRKWESVTRVAGESVEIASLGARFLEQAQENFTAALGRNLTRKWFVRRGTGWEAKSMRDRADIRTVESMGFDRKTSERMVAGEGTVDEYSRFVVTMPKKLAAANMRPADMAKFQSDPTFRSVFKLTRWPINNFRRLATELGQLRTRVRESDQLLREGKITRADRTKEGFAILGRATTIFTGKAAVGSMAYLVKAFVTGRLNHISDDIDEEGLVKFFVGAAFDATMGGQIQSVRSVLDDDKGFYESFSLPVSVSLDLMRLATGTGPYRSLDPLAAVEQFTNRYAPFKRPAETFLYALGVWNEDEQAANRANSRYWKIIYENDIFASDRPSGSRVSKFPEFSRGMKMAARAVQDHEPMSVVYGYINRALKISGLPPAKAAASLLRRRKLAKYANWNATKADGSYSKSAPERKILRQQYEFLRKSSEFPVWAREDARLEGIAASISRRGKD